MRRVAAAILAILVSACASQLYPKGLETMQPAIQAEDWLAADGSRLPLRSWLPPGAPKAVIVAVHGMNDYANAFAAPGAALAAKGIATYAYDQRGFGRGPHPGFWSDTVTMASDLRAIAALLHDRYPQVPLYILGESMGGAVAIVATAGQPPAGVTGLILSAPAVWGRSTMGFAQHAALWLANHIAPGWSLTGHGLNLQPSDNLEMLRALSRDPLVIKETRIDAINGLVNLMDDAQGATSRIGLPVLVLVGAKDEIIPAAPTWAAIRRLPYLGASQRAALYPNGWHMLLRDLQAQVVVDDIAAWIGDPAAALPSGADRQARKKLDESP